MDDYNNGVIRHHELTRPGKERDRASHILATGCQTSPVLLAYPDNPVLEALVEAAKTAEPLYDFTDEDGVRHSVWRVARPAAVESIRMMLEHVDRAYIADGHHRTAAAAEVCQKMRTSEADRCTGREAYNYLLCALFPQSQLEILPYNRLVADTAGLSEDDLVSALETAGVTVGARRTDPIAPSGRGLFGMYAFGAWRELDARGTACEQDALLDATLLQDLVLDPILGVSDPRDDARVSFVGGTVPLEELARRAGEKGVAFSLYPTSMSDLVAAADSGRPMPPKSTWFEPKVKSGLFIRRINHCESVLDGTRKK